MNNNATAETTTPDQESKNIALLNWVGTLFFGFIPPLVLMLVKADDAYVKDQSRKALNWSITAIIAYIVAGLLSFVAIGVFLFPVIALCHLVFCIMGILGTSKGSAFRVPLAIRLLKKLPAATEYICISTRLIR